MLRSIAIIWLLIIHAMAACLLYLNRDFFDFSEGLSENPQPSLHYKYLVRAHQTIDSLVADQAVVFIGDSITEGLNTSAVASNSVNYGISNDTTRGVLRRIDLYQSQERAAVIVLAIGINDLIFRSVEDTARDYSLIIDRIPDGRPVLLSAVLPVDEKTGWPSLNQKIDQLNVVISALADKDGDIYLLDSSAEFKDATGNLKQSLHLDGVHLNNTGYQIWINALKTAISEMQVAY